MDTELQCALALVDASPDKSPAWVDAAGPMCKFCQPGEDVSDAAGRILAAEVRRLTAEIEPALVRVEDGRDALLGRALEALEWTAQRYLDRGTSVPENIETSIAEIEKALPAASP